MIIIYSIENMEMGVNTVKCNILLDEILWLCGNGDIQNLLC